MITIPEYKIIEKINTKPGTELYRAIKIQDNFPVILKYTQDYSHLQKEYEIIKRFNHNCIIQAYGIIPHSNGHILILEDGGKSLKQYVNPILDIKEFLTIAIQLANILSIVHQHGIIHKDIEPTNFVFKKDKSGKIHIKLVDFENCSQLSREEVGWRSIEGLKGSLAYISPEQTGRVNHAIDYRTDFYSLGIIFYELLTGKTPFTSHDSMELIYSHIARQPEDLKGFRQDIPKSITQIVQKLLEKDPEKRYQSAIGIQKDLEFVLDNIISTDFVSLQRFVIGLNDYSGIFRIPQKLYGRKNEVERLLSLFESVVRYRKSELLLVSGYSGVGKTSFVYEIHRAITEKNGYFLEGKFDQYQRNIPFYAIVIAFQGLIKHLLTESESQLKNWKSKLLVALGDNAQIIIDVIPELEYIIGKQKPIPKLGLVESMNRFYWTFQKFIQSFVSEENPIVVFIDDLQWADMSSLNLVKNLILDTDIECLLVIGAYRENEIDTSHPLNFMIDEVLNNQKEIEHIHLMPLDKVDVTSLVSETLKANKAELNSLVELLYKKTDGNPFFLLELLKELHKDGLIVFDDESKRWIWKEYKISSYKVMDNVVDLMVKKLCKLPFETQRLLSYAACLGNQFELKILSMITEKNSIFVYNLLYATIENGMLVPIETNLFRFQHDKIQQAAYSLIEETLKKELHLKIGRLMLENASELNLEDKLFEIVEQYNQAIKLISDKVEKLKIAELNLKAAHKARSSAAYNNVCKYLSIAIELLESDSWEKHYQLTLEIYKRYIEAESLSGNYERASQLFEYALVHAISPIEKAEIYRIQISILAIQVKYVEAISIGYKALELLGIQLPTENFMDVFQEESEKIEFDLQENLIEKLERLDESKDDKLILSIQLLDSLLAPTYVMKRELWIVVLAKIINLSLIHGNTIYSPHAFSGYGMILGALFRKYKTGYEFGSYAVTLAEKLNAPSQKCIALFDYANLILPWVRHIQNSEELNEEGLQTGLNAGEVYYGILTPAFQVYNYFYYGNDLRTVSFWKERVYKLAKKYNHILVFNLLDILDVIMQYLIDTEESNIAASPVVENELLSRQLPTYFMTYYEVFKSTILYLNDSYEEALTIAQNAYINLKNIISVFATAEQNFYYSLILVAICELYPDRKENYWGQLDINQKQMKIWTENCEDNFLHKYLLVEAEKARIEGRNWDAVSLYKKSIDSAKEYGFVKNEALGNELFARFWFNSKNEKVGEVYMKEAYMLYSQWGANLKVKQLKEKYPRLFNANLIDPFKTKNITQYTENNSIDIQTILKSIETISEEIKMDSLLEKVMKIIIENTGAERGALILQQDEIFYADISLKNGINISKQIVSLENCTQLPKKILRFVQRTKESIVLDNAAKDGRYNTDDYIKKNHTKSILCSPILRKGELTGIIYLENNLSTGMFTKDRIQIVYMLSGQIAISLENAMRYQELSNLNANLEESLNKKL